MFYDYRIYVFLEETLKCNWLIFWSYPSIKSVQSIIVVCQVYFALPYDTFTSVDDTPLPSSLRVPTKKSPITVQ